MHDPSLGAWVNAASGLLMIALGLFVASVRGAQRWNRTFSLFAIAFGATWLIDNLTREMDHYVTAGRYGVGACLIVAAIGLLLMALAYPEPWRTASRRIRMVAIAGGLGVGAGFALFQSSVQPAASGALDYGSIIAFRIGYIVFGAVIWGVLFLFAMRFGVTRHDAARERGQYAMMSTSLIPYPAFVLGSASLYYGPTSTTSALALAITIIVMLSYAAAWGWSLRGIPSSGARWIPILAAAVALIGLLTAEWANNPGFGISRTLTVVILAYAILRHQLFGIDLKVRWGISKTTLAGIFVAVFFVASEVAQQFFGEQLGGPYVGIIAAGLLVFAIAPLSRFTDRVAERAVPLSASPADVSPQAVYQGAVRMAWSDDELSESDQDSLAALADSLGLSSSRARAIQREVEEEDHGRSP